MVRFHILGNMSVDTDAGPVAVIGRRRRALLARLLVSANQVVSYDRLVEDLWEGSPPTGARSTLASHISLLRRVIGSDRISGRGGGYLLTVGEGELDSACFEAEAERGRIALDDGDPRAALQWLSRALGRWQGKALADVADADWAMSEVSRLDELRAGAAENLLDARLALGQHHDVVAAAQSAVEEEPLRDRRWAQLMLALYRAGRQADALRTFQRLRSMLGDELGIEPSPRLVALEEAIVLQKPELDWQPPGPALDRPSFRTNLPHQISSFIGRIDEIHHVRELVAAHRLVTLTGAGGAGKTRLALEVAAGLVEEFPGGVWLVDLAPLSAPELVADTVASVLGVLQQPGQPISKVLAEFVSDQHVLLLIDNCEHLVQACADLADCLLKAGGRVRVLATSRQPLRIPGEKVWQVPPLSTPSEVEAVDVERIRQCDAVRLFVDRSLAASPEFEADDPRAIMEIATRLDGLPLAIELAAARVGPLGIKGLAERLDDRLHLLTSGSRTASPRQQTLLATIEWSYRLLDPPDQAVLRRLSVFAGSFTLEAAEVVAAGGHVRVGDVVGIAMELMSKSMLVRDAGVGNRPEPARYRILETIRQYASELLSAADGDREGHLARNAHAEYYRAMARTAAPEIIGPHQAEWLAVLESEHDNLRLAVAHLSAEPGRKGDALQMVIDLRRFWLARGHSPECTTILAPMLEQLGPDVPADLRSTALCLAAETVQLSDLTRADRYAEEALDLARATEDDAVAAQALNVLTMDCYFRGQCDEARGEEAVELARRAADPVLLAECLAGWALTAVSDPGLSMRLHEEALALAEQSGDHVHAARLYNNVGNAYLAAGKLSAARDHFTASLERFDELGSPEPVPLLNLCWVILQQGHVETARDLIVKALGLARRCGLRYVFAYSSFGLAWYLAKTGHMVDSARLLGFADSELGDTWAEPERTYRNALACELREPGGANFEAAHRAGSSLTRDDVLDLAHRAG
jgi:predicted ATPase/DNA-binding SARP family transcriptional activator